MMPDFVTPAIQGTAAERAVRYILERVVNDRNFSWYMWHTQALALCVEAEAQRTGRSRDEVEADLVAASHIVNERLVRNGGASAVRSEVEVLRQRLDRIDQLLGQMRDRGKIDDAHYTQLCDYVHVDPADWKAVEF